MSTTPPPQSDSSRLKQSAGIAFDYVTATVIGLLVLGWLAFLANGKPVIDPDGAHALHVAQNLLDGEGQVIKFVSPADAAPIARPDVTKPPLFPAICALLIFLGMSPQIAGWTVTFVAYALAASFIYLLARRVVSPKMACVVAGVFATLGTSLRWGINLHEESLFLALSFAALWLQMGLRPENRRGFLGKQFLTGILAGLAMTTSYQGLPLLICIGSAALWNAWQQKSTRPFLVYAAGVTVVGLLPMLRFIYILLSGARPGFDTGEPTWYLIISGIVSGWQRSFLGDLFIWLDDGSATDFIVVAVAYGLLAALLVLSWRTPRLRLLVAFVVLYMGMVIIQLGGQGKPYFDTRYNMPVESLIVLLIVYAVSTRFKKLPLIARYTAVTIGLVGVSVYAHGQLQRYSHLMSRSGGEICAAEESIAWIKQNIPAGSVVIGSQCTYQLFIESNDYFWLAIPPARDAPTNNTRWTEADLLTAARNTNSEWVVLITGEDEPLMPEPGYGTYIEGLLSGMETRQVRLAAKLADGLIYHIVPDLKLAAPQPPR